MLIIKSTALQRGIGDMEPRLTLRDIVAYHLLGGIVLVVTILDAYSFTEKEYHGILGVEDGLPLSSSIF